MNPNHNRQWRGHVVLSIVRNVSENVTWTDYWTAVKALGVAKKDAERRASRCGCYDSDTEVGDENDP